jgi:hypothetical protein
VGYESQNSSGAAFAQNSLTIPGLSAASTSQGYMKAYALNGDVYRATLDWSAKWHGFAVNTAAYFQQVNANPYAGSATAGLPYKNMSSFFQQGDYVQLGYMIVPQRFELLGRAGILLDEGDSNIAQYYTLGAKYYLYGTNANILADLDYTPQTAYTNATTLQILNTEEIYFRLQLQLKF